MPLVTGTEQQRDTWIGNVSIPYNWIVYVRVWVWSPAQLQRGYKIYREVCAACHSMELLSFRNLGEKGGPFYDPEYPNPNDNEELMTYIDRVYNVLESL